MDTRRIRDAWESAAPGWARWESTVAEWMAPATEMMLDQARLAPGAQVIDVACGAGSQTLLAARRVTASGHVLATDISETMLEHVRDSARAAGLPNVGTRAGAAEELALDEAAFDAAICRLGLMLFASPVQALAAVRRALKPRGRVAVVVFTTPDANAAMARPMQVLLRNAGKAPPAPGQPGIFALGAPDALERAFAVAGLVDVERRTVSVPLRMASAAQALEMMQQAFGAYRAVVADQPDDVRAAAWREVEAVLDGFAGPDGFVAPAEVCVASAARPA